MKRKRIEEGRFTENARGLGTVTEEMVERRAAELALISGRPDQVLDSDLDQARRELQGRERVYPEPSPSAEIPEEERGTGLPDNDGQQTPTVPASDEQTFAEKLVEEGLEDAEQDRMVEGTRRAAQQDEES